MAQAHQVYSWVGGSGSWHNPDSWTVNGTGAAHYPQQGDVAFISTSEPISIWLDQNAFAEALTTAGNGKITFTAKKNGAIEINSSCIISDETVLDRNVKIVVKGKEGYYNYPENLSDQIEFKSKKGYEKFADLPKASGSCPFFTIVSNSTGPTCNGFSNGVASVEVPVDGVGPYTYQWIGGPTTRQWNNVGAGTYTVIIFDVGQGAPCNIDVFINEPGPLTVFSMNASPPLCADVCNGTASPIVIGGNGGYILSWSSGETGLNASMLCPVFTLNIEDQMGCMYDTTYTYPNPPDTIKFTAAITEIDCFGNNNGAIDVSISGGVGSFTPSWTGPNGFTAATEDISNLEPGDYFLQVEDANNCLADTVFTITENLLLTATSSKIDNACGGGSTGSINITPAGGATPYSYVWTGPDGYSDTNQNIGSLASGLYEVTITDAALCTLTLQITIGEPAEINVDFTSGNVLCAGGATGVATASASGGTAGYSYAWTGPASFSANGPGITNLLAGIYSVTITDAALCTYEESIEITQPDSIQASFTVSDITCNNGGDGSIVSAISGGTVPYTTSWTGPAGFTSANQDISSLSSGTYTLTITDGNNCQIIETVDISNPASIAVTATVTSSSCSNGNDGAIDITAAGGTEPYTYAWTGPAGFTSTNEDLTNRPGGSYTVTVTDANLCSASATYIINAPSALSATFTKVNASCFGVSDGSINTNPSGGVAPYSFVWVGPAGFISTDQNITGLLGGSYSVQISDANGCAGFLSVTITQPPKINVTGPITHVTCFGGANGSIDAIVNGGTPGYTYSWSGPNGFSATTQDVTGLVAGTYTLTVTDAIMCSRSRDYVVNQPLEITVNATITDVLCAGDSDGSISVTVSNGVAPYSLAWTGPAGFTSTMPSITGLVGGTYNLTVTDNNSCTVSHQYVVIETVVLTISEDVSDVLCFGDLNGSIDITPQGGAEPYTVSWTGPDGFSSNDISIADLATGDYEITLSDDGGCTITQIITVGSPDALDLTIDIQNITCAGNGDGSLTANLTGGTTPYAFAWSGPDGFSSTQQNILALDSGLYQLTVTDANNCIISGTASITEPAILEMTVEIIQPGCLADDGVLTANVSGGTIAVDYTYSWENGMGIEVGTTASIVNLGPGDYTITVTDDNGCTIQQTIELTRVNFNIIAAVNGVSCFGAADGSVQLSPINGTAPYTYSWIGPDGFTSTNSLIENLATGQYEVNVEDAAGCILNVVYDVDQPNEIGFSAIVLAESCPGEMNGAIDLTITGGTPGFLVTWIGPDGFTANTLDIDDLVSGGYTASVTDVNGCTKDTLIDVTVGDDFAIVLTPTNPICTGELTGSITADAFPSSGAPGVFSFNWTGPNAFSSANQNISNLDAGVYIVSITSENGCTKQDTTELFMPDSILIDLTIVNSNCLQADGSASAVVFGGVGALSVRWLDNVGNEIATGLSVSNLSSGIYTIEVTDDAGCVITQTVAISDSSGSVDGIISAPVCVGNADAAIDVTVVNGAEPFTYEWSDGISVISTDEDISGIAAGTYNVVVTDDNGCTYTASFNISDPAPISVAETISGVSCNGGDGAISLEITNASNPVTVEWTGPSGFTATGINISNLDIGIYDYTITDANFCSTTGSVEILAVDDILASADVENVLCGGESSGSIDLTISGGVSPLSYSWSDGAAVISTIQDIADVPAGNYTVTITDAQNCSIAETIIITENTPIEAVYTIVQPDCAVDNGSISVVLSGGVVSTDYFISWTDPDGNTYPATADLTGLGVGIYIFSGSDDNGCAIDTTITLTNPDADISLTATGLTCPGSNDGSIVLEIADVEEPYTVAWTGPGAFTSDQEDIFDLEPGIYEYTVTGNNGCEYIDMAVVNPADSIQLSGEVFKSCFGQNTGSISLDLNGANQPFEFTWIGPDGYSSTDEDIDNLAPGTYEVTVTDSNLCTVTSDFEITENPEILVDITKTDISCSGDSTGAIDVVVSGGLAPLAISWTGPDGFISTDANLSELIGGEYVLQVSDSSGCVLDSMITIIQPEPITITATVVAAGCSAFGNLGSIELTVSGGTPNYSIAWTGPDGFSSIDFAMIDLEPGLYNYTITDASGCELTGEIMILDVEPIDVEVVSQDILCAGENNGQAFANITGGMEPYEINWTGPAGFTSSELSITDLIAGEYTLSVNDSAGCSFTETIEIIDPAPIAIESEIFDASCNTSPDGSVGITVSGGTEPYTFTWTGSNSFTSTLEDLSGVPSGTYNLILTDNNGCEATTAAEVDFTLEVSVNAGTDTLICESDLPVTFTGTGENVDEFSWLDLDGNLLSDTASLEFFETPGAYTYIFYGTDGFCETQDTIYIQVLANPDADAGIDREVFVEEVFTLGGNPTSATAVSYLWSPNPTESLNITSANPSGYLLESTDFIVVVSDQNGCLGRDTVYVEVLPDVIVTSGFTPNGDGVNDTWVIDNMELFPNNVVNIFNRWGQAVYSQTPYNSGNAWDGTYEGEKLPVGTYYYTIELNDDRFPDPLTGPITIYR
ncbi:T9SS type B sorting domain-containing protein [Cryomorpha ignava]|nr:gliding motility-associated C-terminal domain-containing protein [Cryomorpha ignava]